MKKLLSVLLAAAMVLCLASCGGTGTGDSGTSTSGDSGTTSAGDTGTTAVDLSAYPASIDDWTIEDMMNYFTEAGVFTNEDWKYIQNEEESYPSETGFSKCGSYMSDDEEGSITVFIFWFDPDASQSKVSEQYEYIKENKAFDEAFDGEPVDHMVGRFAFTYGVITLDEDAYNAIEQAYNDLVTGLGATAEF